MNTTLLRRRSWAAFAVAGLALTTTLTGIATTATAATTTTAKEKPGKGCPLTDGERLGEMSEIGDIDRALDFYPGTLYIAPGKTLEVGTQSAYFRLRPIGTLTVSTQRSPRTIVRFCANQDGSMRVVFPADTITGSATITMSSRTKMWQGPGQPMKKDVFRKKFNIVALSTMPASPLNPTDVRAEVRSDGLLFTWTPASAQPQLEHYQFTCGLPTVVKPQVLMPWDVMNLQMQPDGTIPLNIWTANVAGLSKLQTGWSYDPGRRTVTRVY